LEKRVTILDIAKQLGVSTTTVNKALSGKPKVSDNMRKRVIETSEAMGYRPNKSAQALARRQLKIGIVVSRTPDEYTRYIIAGYERGFQDYYDHNIKGIFRTVDNLFATEQSMRIIRELREQEVDGIIIQPVMGYQEYADLIDETMKSGIRVVASVSKLYENKNASCVRINSRIVGQMAGQFMNMVLPRGSKVAVLTSNKEMQIHLEYVEGFEKYIDKQEIHLVDVLETNDVEYIAYNVTEELLRKYPDINGIYVSSYVSVPVCKCIEKHGKKNEIVVIGQDLYPELVENLLNGSLNATIFQDQYLQGRKAVAMMYGLLTDNRETSTVEYLVTPQLVLTSNLSCYKDRY
jgi:LacI family transcriptional regulator